MLPLTLLTLTLSALPTALTTALPYATSPYSPQNCQSTITENGGVFFCNGYNYMATAGGAPTQQRPVRNGATASEM